MVTELAETESPTGKASMVCTGIMINFGTFIGSHRQKKQRKMTKASSSQAMLMRQFLSNNSY